MADPIELVSTLIEHRDALVKIWGDNYTENIRPWREALRAMRENCPDAPMAVLVLNMGRKLDSDRHDPSPLFAAFVDECADLAVGRRR